MKLDQRKDQSQSNRNLRVKVSCPITEALVKETEKVPQESGEKTLPADEYWKRLSRFSSLHEVWLHNA